MRHGLVTVGLAVLMSGIANLTFAGSVALPFPVTVGGQAAQAEGPVARTAVPVAADALVEAGAKGEMMLINIFRSDAKGNVTTANASAQEIIMVNGASNAKLNQTMSKKPLSAGQYLMNIVVGSNTSRVTFTVK